MVGIDQCLVPASRRVALAATESGMPGEEARSRPICAVRGCYLGALGCGYG
jgi:hypothetical protein